MTIESNWCTLKVSNDNLYALMCLHSNDNEEELSLTEQIVLDFLNSQDITYGISNVAIQSLLSTAMYEQYICVAKGTPALRGSDGYFKFEKDTQDMKMKPLINEDGTADYKNSLSLATISEGELLAVYIHPTKGSTGMDVYGREIASPGDGKDIKPLNGRGIIREPNSDYYYAQYSGHIIMDGSKISIDKLYRVDGDLNIEVGNIRFDGDVEIMGDVRSGLEINATGNIFIHGHVGACNLTAQKNITIEKGIQGRNSCVIDAGENVTCKFVESCTINAGQNIYADSVLSSTLTAKNQVLVTSKNGNVISSDIYGMSGVIVREAGNDAGAPTLLRAGMPREYYQRAIELNKMIQEVDSKTATFNHHLESIDKALSEITDPKLSDTRMQIVRAKIVLAKNRSEYMEELSELNQMLEKDSENSFINVTGTVYDGVRVYIGSSPYLVNNDYKEVSFRLHRNEVIMGSLETEDNRKQ